jgi:hypothetical protein
MEQGNRSAPLDRSRVRRHGGRRGLSVAPLLELPVELYCYSAGQRRCSSGTPHRSLGARGQNRVKRAALATSAADR